MYGIIYGTESEPESRRLEHRVPLGRPFQSLLREIPRVHDVSPQPMMPNSRSRVYACGRGAQCSSSRPSTPLRRRSRFGFQGTGVVPWRRDEAAGPPSRPRPTVMSAVPLGAAIIKRIRRSCGSSATNLRCGRMRHGAPPRGGNCRKHERVRKLAAVDSLSDESVE